MHIFLFELFCYDPLISIRFLFTPHAIDSHPYLLSLDIVACRDRLNPYRSTNQLGILPTKNRLVCLAPLASLPMSIAYRDLQSLERSESQLVTRRES